MTTKIIRTAANLKTVLSAQNTYFVVEADVTLQGSAYVLGNGCVIEFSGGSFQGITGTSLNLNGGQVIADPYPIFKNMDVTGFSNSRVFAEWFIDGNEDTPEVYINKALRCAKGCPVVLSKQVYKLTGTIVFPSTAPSTLIATGSLEIDKVYNDISNDPIAIDINVNNVTIYIDRIRFRGTDINVLDKDGKPVTTTIPHNGTAIRISGEVIHTSINVNKILFPKRGIDISPGRAGTYASIQYLNVKFQEIYAIQCIYFNIYSKGIPSKNWVTRSFFNGGRLHGDYGIYIARNENKDVVYDHISELCFSNIGLEGFNKSPLYLRDATRLRFENIRMAEGMPAKDYPWIYLQDMSWANFDIHGDLNADKIEASGRCAHIKIKGSFLQNTDWIQSPFDTLVINPVWINNAASNNQRPQKALTSSVNPVPMTNVIKGSANLQEIQPTIISEVTGKFSGVKALPRMLQFAVTKYTEIDLTGLQNYAPCMFYFSLANNVKLKFKSSSAGSFIPISVNDVTASVSNSEVTLNEKGVYRLTWMTYKEKSDEPGEEQKEVTKWAVYITKVSN